MRVDVPYVGLGPTVTPTGRVVVGSCTLTLVARVRVLVHVEPMQRLSISLVEPCQVHVHCDHPTVCIILHVHRETTTS